MQISLCCSFCERPWEAFSAGLFADRRLLDAYLFAVYSCRRRRSASTGGTQWFCHKEIAAFKSQKLLLGNGRWGALNMLLKVPDSRTAVVDVKYLQSVIKKRGLSSLAPCLKVSKESYWKNVNSVDYSGAIWIIALISIVLALINSFVSPFDSI